MIDYHPNSNCGNIFSTLIIEKNLINNKEYIEQQDKIINSKGKLIVYLSIIYGAIVAAGLTSLFIF